MSGRFVRASKFRHVHGVNVKKEKAFMNIRGSCTGEGNYIAANSRYWAVPFAGGGGPVLIGRHDKPGRVEHNAPKLNVHKTAVLDLAFSPFHDNVLATVGEEGSLKVTALPDDGAYDKIQEAHVSLDGHTKKLAFVRWHPNSQGIIATSAFDNLVKIWDIESAREILNNEDHPDLPQSIEWNENGSLLATSCKDKFMRVFDPRQKTAAQKTVGIDGGKSWRVVWMDNRGKIGAVGFSKSNARCVGAWDPRKFDTPLNIQDIDTSASVMIPYYDPDTSVLFIAGKGDACIRYYELTDEDPFLFFLADFRDTESTKGACFLPKFYSDTKTCEIAVCYRLMKEFIQPVPFVVPRKSELFQADLYPDTYAAVPATTAGEYMAGVSRPVIKRGMKPGSPVPTSAIPPPAYAAVSASAGAGAGAASPSAGAAAASASASASGSASGMSPEAIALQAALAKIAELEAKLAKLEAK